MPKRFQPVSFDSFPPTRSLPPDPLPAHLLPRFRVKRRPNDRVVTVVVHSNPDFGDDEKMTWTALARPVIPLQRGLTIALATGPQSSGSGRLSRICGMTRHWVTFGITGSNGTCRLRAPIPWVQLNAIEAHAHSRHFPSLARLPHPPPEFMSPLITDSDTSPYEFEPTDIAAPSEIHQPVPMRNHAPTLPDDPHHVGQTAPPVPPPGQAADIFPDQSRLSS